MVWEKMVRWFRLFTYLYGFCGGNGKGIFAFACRRPRKSVRFSLRSARPKWRCRRTLRGSLREEAPARERRIFFRQRDRAAQSPAPQRPAPSRRPDETKQIGEMFPLSGFACGRTRSSTRYGGFYPGIRTP